MGFSEKSITNIASLTRLINDGSYHENDSRQKLVLSIFLLTCVFLLSSHDNVPL